MKDYNDLSTHGYIHKWPMGFSKIFQLNFVFLIPIRPNYGYDWISATEGIANQDEYLCLKAGFEEKLHCI